MCFYSAYVHREVVHYLFQHKNITKLLIFRHFSASTSRAWAKYLRSAFGPKVTFSALFLNRTKLTLFRFVSISNCFFEIIICFFPDCFFFSYFLALLFLWEKKKKIDLNKIIFLLAISYHFLSSLLQHLVGSLVSDQLFYFSSISSNSAHTSVLFLKSLPRKSVQLIRPKHKLYYK